MTADEFSKELKLLAPPIDDLRKIGLSLEGAERIHRSYHCSRISSSETGDPIVDLCTNFDVSTVSIGTITLCRIAEFDPRHWKVGEDEMDPLVLAKTADLISVRDHENL